METARPIVMCFVMLVLVSLVEPVVPAGTFPFAAAVAGLVSYYVAKWIVRAIERRRTGRHRTPR